MDVVTTIDAPEGDAEWLQELFDESEFIARNVIRQYGGWWTGRPSELKPATRTDVAAELVALAGGVDTVTQRAVELTEENRYRLATHLVDYALEAAPGNESVRDAAETVYETRADAEESLMGTNIFLSAAEYARTGRPFR